MKRRTEAMAALFGIGIVELIALIQFLLAFQVFGAGFTDAPVRQQRTVSVTQTQEIEIGLQAAPEMAAKYGGESNDPDGRRRVETVGRQVVEKSDAKKAHYRFKFHLLADRQRVNALALPGGQVFITEGLYRNLRTDGELAAVLAHEIGHVVAAHATRLVMRQELAPGLKGSAVLAGYDPDNIGSRSSESVALAIHHLVDMKFQPQDEREADRLGVQWMTWAGFDPRATIGVIRTLNRGDGSGRPADFFSTHPNSDKRIGLIQSEIQEICPNGVPPILRK